MRLAERYPAVEAERGKNYVRRECDGTVPSVEVERDVIRFMAEVWWDTILL